MNIEETGGTKSQEYYWEQEKQLFAIRRFFYEHALLPKDDSYFPDDVINVVANLQVENKQQKRGIDALFDDQKRLANENHKLQAENKRLITWLWKIRQEHIENRRSSYGKVRDYIDEAIGKERLKKRLDQSLAGDNQ